MPLSKCKKLFPRATKDQLAAKRNTDIKIKTYIQTTITQLGTYVVNTEHNNKQKICTFRKFVSIIRHARY